mmetsp:Transcript_33508/g.39014  ORF Transcript_33508/g.39014 Transcript_33508/m.39014 type:complete len:300 (+) Transcript_33508:36-935(+)
MDVDQIFEWIITHPTNYPGRHLDSQPRTSPTLKPLEPKSQFHIIFKALSEYIREKMQNGKSVSVKGLGGFSFEIISEKVKPAIFTTVDFKKPLDDQRAERKHVHAIRPCFLVDSKFKYLLSRFPGKQEIEVPKSQHSVFQQGFGMIFCNSVPIANACYLAKEVVSSAIDAFVTAVNDLTRLGYDLRINFGFCCLSINDRNLTVKYNETFSSSLNKSNFETKLRKSDQKTGDHWRTSFQEKWMNSTLGTLLKKPPQEKIETLAEKTLALKIMSLDMNTAEKTINSRTKSVGLPRIDSKKP